MEMNVSKNDEQVVARKAGGLNPAVIIPILFLIGIAIYLFVLGNPGNFKDAEKLGGGSVAFSSVEGKDIHPESFLGIIYKGGVIVPILITFMITVIVFSFERYFVLGKAAGKGNLDNFVVQVRSLLNQNKICMHFIILSFFVNIQVLE